MIVYDVEDEVESNPDYVKENELKMAPYRHKKPAPTDYTTDEEDIITYDVEEDELEQRPNLVQKDGRQYWKGSLLLTPTRLRK
ncbi:hypothetical protein TNCV_3162191 [Trichonephila clavipes]|nr:hypothetical protein TNCV_3162191 [Trichonephila clavipes]